MPFDLAHQFCLRHLLLQNRLEDLDLAVLGLVRRRLLCLHCLFLSLWLAACEDLEAGKAVCLRRSGSHCLLSARDGHEELTEQKQLQK